MEIATPLEKTCKVPSNVADEASEQRGSYSKVNRLKGQTPEDYPVRHPKQGTRAS